MLSVDLPGIAIFVGDSRVRKAEQVSPVPSPARPPSSWRGAGRRPSSGGHPAHHGIFSLPG